LATAQSKNKWFTDSFSLQNRQEGSLTFLLRLKLSLVNTLFLEKKPEKEMHPRWYFEVPHNMNMNSYTSEIYDFVKRLGRINPLELKVQIKESSSSENTMVEASCIISCHLIISLSSTPLLKVHFKSTPSQRSKTV
jgi:hypothetical protein